MGDAIRALAETPLPTLLVIIGIVMLSVGIGVKIKAFIDVSRINKTYAKAIGINGVNKSDATYTVCC